MIIAKNLTFSINDYANKGNSIIGIRGSGKTYTATKNAEELMKAGIPIIVFDPTGVWQNLRYGTKGNAGFPVVVAGGLKPDLELTPQNCTQLVEAALKEKVSLIIDLQGRSTATKSKWLHIVSECVEYLMQHNLSYGIRHVFIEEAAEFIPQRPNPGGAMAYSRLESMARQGRNYGIGYTLINQRAEEIAKAIFEICETVFVHRQNGKNSLKSIDSWLNYKGLEENNIVKSLPKLQNGECWVINQDGEKLIKVLPKQTFHPDPEKQKVVAPTKNVADVSGFITRMKSVMNIQADEPKTHKVNNAAITKLEDENKVLKEINRVLEENNKVLRGELISATNKLLDINRLSKPTTAAELEPVLKKEKVVIRQQPYSPPQPTEYNKPKSSSGQTRILNTCAMFHPNAVSKSRIGLIADLSPGSGSFNTYISNLKREGFIEVENGGLKITQEGLQKVGNIEPMPTGDELVNMWCSHVGAGSGAGRILKYLAGRHPKAQTKAEIGDAVGLSHSSGSFNTYISTLKRNSLITSNGGTFKAADELFT